MSYDLCSPSTGLCLTFSRQFLFKALELAELYGWQPRRTQPPASIDFCALGADWHGSYLTNDGQTVMASDARWLAAALERSLIDIPDTGPQIDWDPERWVEDDLPEWLSPQEITIMEDEIQEGCLDLLRLHPLEHFAGAEKAGLIRFIRFCRLGSFEIL
ncbi:MAG: hypothetical protein ACM3XO_03140 [Bacteroidota bacterium]|jgi:hypothetical protein